ncbi:MAG: glycosyltransferase [Mesorhizobium sp.]|uniref:glycosyltransferase n=1 Tax=Mesorhizobium sp. TaxID=1871066 RepID=UPI001217E33C|nr:glycosyltransferase [Mesorhizobium sp.]TIM41738.1 MAG: glycosyltransferase [Mesorhizobium sp.]
MACHVVSIITICFNNPKELEATLRSFEGLSSAIEVVVVDGSPGDACAAVAGSREGITYLHGRDTGKYDAMNKGLAVASGTSAIVINSGDRLVDAVRFSAVVDENRDILDSTIVYGDHLIEFPDIGFSRVSPRHPTLTGIRRGELPSHQAVLIPMRFYRANCYDDTMQYSADTKLMRTAFSQMPSKYLAEAFAVFSAGGISNMPGQWRGVIRHYREMCAARDLTRMEELGLLLRLLVRKTTQAAIGGRRLSNIQRQRAVLRERRS